MKQKTQKILFIVSVIFNILFVALIVSSLFVRTSSITYYNPEDKGKSGITAAMIISLANDPDEQIVFGPAEITIRKGGSASLQISAIKERKQANWLLALVYDRSIVSLTATGYGVVINAVAAGETVLQTLGEDGIKDVAAVKVLP
jgi:hypothetical protein